MAKQAESPQRRKLLAGASAACMLAAAAPLRPLLAASDMPTVPAELLNKSQRGLLAMLTETIIPQTDTPGAIQAAVPQYVEHMVATWMSAAERQEFLRGLSQIEAQAQANYEQPYVDCNTHQRETLLEQLERQAGNADWYIPGNVNRAFLENAPFICQLKELTVWGYFTSEVGAQQSLTENFAGGEFDGDIPLSELNNSWAAVFTTY